MQSDEDPQRRTTFPQRKRKSKSHWVRKEAIKTELRLLQDLQFINAAISWLVTEIP